MSIPEHHFDESIEMYLKTIRELSARYDPVPIAALAERLGVSNVSANEMMHRLKNQALIEHIPYKGVALTDEGLRRAYQIIRRHRLWERFLVDQLGISWEQSHDFACRMEHASDNEVTDALAAFLGNPETCPHGNPIPYNGQFTINQCEIPLNELGLGQQGVIQRIHPESALVLDYLAARGLKPGVGVRVSEVAPFQGPITVRVDERAIALGREVATYIYLTIEEQIPAKESAKR